MTISFHGAARTVTGSKHLVGLSTGEKFLLDCGMFQGMGNDTDDLNENFGFDPTELSFLLLSHAHIDHTGLLPRLVKNGFKDSIYAFKAKINSTSVSNNSEEKKYIEHKSFVIEKGKRN